MAVTALPDVPFLLRSALHAVAQHPADGNALLMLAQVLHRDGWQVDLQLQDTHATLFGGAWQATVYRLNPPAEAAAAAGTPVSDPDLTRFYCVAYADAAPWALYLAAVDAVARYYGVTL